MARLSSLLQLAASGLLFSGAVVAQNHTTNNNDNHEQPTNSSSFFTDPVQNMTTVEIYVQSNPLSINGTDVPLEPQIQRVTYFQEGKYAIIDGDVLFGTVDQMQDATITNISDAASRKRALSLYRWSNGDRWPGGLIKYRWETAEGKNLMLDEWEPAMKLWTDRLPFLKFQEVSDSPSTKLEVGVLNLRVESTQGACFSPIGMSMWAGGSVMLFDTNKCSIPTTAHEIGHSLGLFHEQQRPDRDQYLDIKCENLRPDRFGTKAVCGDACNGWGCAFRKMSELEADWSGTYDVESIMHYGDSDFSYDWWNVPVLVGKNGVKLHRGFSPHPSLWDSVRVCNIYPEDCRGVCGDGVLAPANGEECDDGNNIDGDGCSANCKKESGTPTPYCGDGIVEPGIGEQCDDGAWNGVYDCTTDCKWKTQPPGRCGDGIVQPELGEECDHGLSNGQFSCSSDCKLVKDGFCGDGIVQPEKGEECDDGGTSATCTNKCKFTDTTGGGGPCSTCDPTAGKNKCHISTSCISGQSENHYCACAHGFRAGGGAKADDTSIQFRLDWTGQEGRVFVKPGVACNELCDRWTLGRDGCTEVPVADKCF